METPVRCGYCWKDFDMNEGYGADIIQPKDEIICPDCHNIDARYEQVKLDYEEISEEMSEAIYTIKQYEASLMKNKQRLQDLIKENIEAFNFLRSHKFIEEPVIPE